MGRKRKAFPTIQNDRGRARVWWNGRWHYLGEYGSDEAKSRHARLVHDIAMSPNSAGPVRGDYLLGELVLEYLRYVAAQGRPKETARVTRVFSLLEAYHSMAVAEFGPVAVDAWRHWLAGSANGGPAVNATTVRYYVRVVRDALAWAIRTERVHHHETKLDGIRELKPMATNKVRRARKVLPVSDELVERTLPHLRGPVAAMVQLQRLTGMRPTEVRRLTPGQVHRSGVVRLSSGLSVDLSKYPGVWVYVPETHKTEHMGKTRDIPLGPKAQAVLLPFLDRDPDACCFSPKEAVEELRAMQVAERMSRGGGSGGSRKPRGRPGRKPNVRYSADAYGRSIRQVCLREGIPPWHPYQIRHTVGTDILASGGLDAARAMLGHDDPRTTVMYAERDFPLAARMAAENG